MAYDRAQGGLAAATLKRVMVVGCSGAGKSTLAREVGRTLLLPVHHLDAHFWLPGWRERPQAAFRERQQALVAAERWVIDGNYRRTMDVRLPLADTVIMIDVSRPLALWRVAARRWRYRGRSRPDLAVGCPEKLDLALLQWIWRFPTINRPEILQRIAAFDQIRLLHLDGARAARRFVTLLAAEGGAADLSPFWTQPAGR